MGIIAKQSTLEDRLQQVIDDINHGLNNGRIIDTDITIETPIEMSAPTISGDFQQIRHAGYTTYNINVTIKNRNLEAESREKAIAIIRELEDL